MTDIKPRLILTGDDTILSDGTAAPNGPHGTSGQPPAADPEPEADPHRVFIHIELHPSGELNVKMQVHTPTQALRMLLFLANECSVQADNVIRENMDYMEMIAEFNRAAQDAGYKPAPTKPVSPQPGKVIGSPQRPARQTAIAVANAAELSRLDELTKGVNHSQ